MAIYKRTYRRYTGPLTPSWSRFLVLYRYSRKTLLRSRLLTGFFVLCFFYPVLSALGIYLTHNLDFVSKYGFDVARFLAIDNRFFFYFIDVQGALAFRNHMGSRPHSFRYSGEHRAAMAAGESLDRWQHRSWLIDLDCDFVFAFNGSVRLGEMEIRCWRAHAGSFLFLLRLRACHQRGHADRVRQLD